VTSDVPVRRAARFSAIALTGAALAGCYHGTARDASPAQLRAEDGWTIIKGVPVIRQAAPGECGVAALSMVLQQWGAPSSSPAELKRDLAPQAESDGGEINGEPPGEEGVAAGELRDLARRRGLRVFLIRAGIDDLSHELGAGRAVLVGLKQRYSDRTLSHYEVVVGINAHRRRVLLFDPGHGPREDGFDGFIAEWAPTDDLAIVVTGWSSPPPGNRFAPPRGGP